MQIVKANAVEIFNPDPMCHIERIGRICYKSEEKIVSGSAPIFIGQLFGKQHHAMLEHFRFIMEVSEDIFNNIMIYLDDVAAYQWSPYVPTQPRYILGTNENGRFLLSGSARGLIEQFRYGQNGDIPRMIEAIIAEYNCTELFGGKFSKYIAQQHDDITVFTAPEFYGLSRYEYMVHGWHSVLFTTDRGVSHEMVRMRDASFAQESTRYCNYGHDNEITVLKPCFWEEGSTEYNCWLKSMASAEADYLSLIAGGAQPQQARSVLPNSTKTEIVVTAPNYEWLHIKNLRLLGKTGAPHPQMFEVMEILDNNYEWMRDLR